VLRPLQVEELGFDHVQLLYVMDRLLGFVSRRLPSISNSFKLCCASFLLSHTGQLISLMQLEGDAPSQLDVVRLSAASCLRCFGLHCPGLLLVTVGLLFSVCGPVRSSPPYLRFWQTSLPALPIGVALKN
jgi:hypothetical protein